MRHRVYLCAFSAFFLLAICNLRAKAQCPNPVVNLGLPTPTIGELNVNTTFIRGTVTSAPPGSSVVVCDSGAVHTQSVSPADDGSYVVATNGFVAAGAFTATTKIYAQIKTAAGVYGPPSVASQVRALCSVAPAAAALPAPSLNIATGSDKKSTVSGKVDANGTKTVVAGAAGAASTVRVCVNDEIVGPGIAVSAADGTYQATGLGIAPADGTKVNVAVQQVITGLPAGTTYSQISKATAVSSKDNSSDKDDWRYSFIGGGEWSGFSSLGQSANAFVQFYLEGTEQKYGKFPGHSSGWIRLRLLSGPQASTNGIGSAFADPTGTITKLDFSNIGQSFDLVAGASKFLTPTGPSFGRIALIVGVGETSPLSSKDVAYTFTAPDKGTVECQELLDRFGSSKGYSPGLTADPSRNGCIGNTTGTFKYLAFANQDRTNFYFKWGAGIRFAQTCPDNKKCVSGLGLFDLTFGQDASITGGQVRNFLIKADGQLPLKKYLYLFGSAYSRLIKNKDVNPLILQAATGAPTPPSADVVVLPLRQPNRDFYRLGIGLNLNQVFSKLFQ